MTSISKWLSASKMNQHSCFADIMGLAYILTDVPSTSITVFELR